MARRAGQAAEDDTTQEAKAATALKATLASYIARVESNQETKKQMKKEWADEEAAHIHGGKRTIPVTLLVYQD